MNDLNLICNMMSLFALSDNDNSTKLTDVWTDKITYAKCLRSGKNSVRVGEC